MQVCAPVHHLIASWQAEVRRRSLYRSFLLHIVLLFALTLAAVLFFSQSAFLVNAASTSNLMYNFPLRTPAYQFSPASPATPWPWIGPLVAFSNCSSLSQTLLFNQNLLPCSSLSSCFYSPVVEQIRSQEYAFACSAWPMYANFSTCSKTVFTNCLNQGLVGSFAGVLVPDPAAPSHPLDNMCGEIGGYNSLQGCVYQADNWFLFNSSANGTSSWLDDRTRNVVTSLALFLPGSLIVQAQTVLVEVDMSGLVIPSVISFAYAPPTAQSLVGALGFLTACLLIDMTLLLIRLCKERLNFFTSWWCLYEIVLFVFSLGFVILLFLNWSQGSYNFAAASDNISPLGRPACQPNHQAGQFYLLYQWFGLLFALALVRLFKFAQFLPGSLWVWTASVRSLDTLLGAAFLVGFVMTLLAYSLVIMLGSNSTVFSVYYNALSALIVLSIGRDVGVLYSEMFDSLPQAPIAVNFFWILVLLIAMTVISTLVSAIVAVTTLNVQRQHLQQLSATSSGGRFVALARRSSKYHIQSCRMAFTRLMRRARFVLTSRKRYDLVGPETCLERLQTWTLLRDNRDKTFITFDEVEEAICRISETKRLRRMDPRQVNSFFTACGPAHVYTVEQAKMLERDWREAIDVRKKWASKDAMAIALECKRVAGEAEENEPTQSLGGMEQANADRALRELAVAVTDMRDRIGAVLREVTSG